MRVDDRDASGCGRAAEQLRRDRPEHAGQRPQRHLRTAKPNTSSHMCCWNDTAMTSPTAVRSAHAGHVESPFTTAIGGAPDDHHRAQRCDERERRDRAQQESTCAGDVLEQLRQPQEHAVVDDGVEEEDGAEKPELGLAKPRLREVWPAAWRTARSSAIVRTSQSRSSADSQRASSGRSVSTTSARRPSTTAGSPSTRKSHCHPRSPSVPLSFSSAWESGAPMMTATGDAIMKSAPVRARSEAGNQYVKKSTMPGKNPASAMPRMTRAAMNVGASRYEHRRHRHQAPADHDAGDPAPGAHALEDQVARNFEQAIAEEEQAGGQAVAGSAETEFALELRRDKADVDAIDVGDDVADEGKWQEAAPDARNDAAALCAGIVRHAGVVLATDDCRNRRQYVMSRCSLWARGAAGRRSALADQGAAWACTVRFLPPLRTSSRRTRARASTLLGTT